MLLALDRHAQVRDLTYPHVGLYNHVAGYPQMVGVWCNGKFAWLGEDSWTKVLGYDHGSLIGNSTFTHQGFGIELTLRDAIHPVDTAWIRRIEVKNLDAKGDAKDVRFFVYHDLRIEESEIGDCSLYVPEFDAVAHVKGPHCFLFTGRGDEDKLFQYTTGHRGFEDYLGSWQDCEDGWLSFHPIAQGMVDSAIGLQTIVEPGSTGYLDYWIVAGKDFEEAGATYTKLKPKHGQAVFDAAAAHGETIGTAFLAKVSNLDSDLRDIANRALQILLTQINHNGGILAANDSDIMVTNKAHYSYVWPRDAALVARSLDVAGRHKESYCSFEFAKLLGADRRGYFHQKYRVDATFGCSWHPWITEHGVEEVPCQQDETALTLLALLEHHEQTGASLEPFAEFIEATSNWLLFYRDPKTGLPRPSHDLWEERKGVHIFTVASVIAALKACSRVLAARSKEFALAAETMQAAMEQRMFSEKLGRFLRRLWKQDGTWHEDQTPDSSSLFVGLLNVLPADHPMILQNRSAIKSELWSEGPIGGMVRYPRDWYFRQGEGAPSNPWIICTMWLAQSLIQSAKTAEDLQEPMELLRWAHDRAETTGVMAEQFSPYDGSPLSVSPLTWSHAEVVLTAVRLSEKLAKLQ